MHELSLVHEKMNPVLRRNDMVFDLSYTGKTTPSHGAVKKMIAEKLKIQEPLIVVRHIHQAYGFAHARLDVAVYDNDASLQAIEIVKKKKKAAPAEAAEKKA